MKVSKKINNPGEKDDIFTKYRKKGFKICVIEEIIYLFPPLVNRRRCFSYNPQGGCLYCGNKTFRFHSKGYGKKYYQCEKCWGLNH